MSEEQEKIEKPKVTLIKQPKREVEKTEPVEVEQEKKKVVIKKKKVVAKKKPAPADIPADNIPQIKAVAPAPEPPKAVPAQEHVPEVSKPAAVTEAPAAPKAVKQPENAEPAAAQPQTQSQPAPSQGQNREGYRSRDGWQGQGGGYRPRGENQGQNREGYRSRDGWQGQGGGYRPRGENQGQNREGYRSRDGWQGQGGGYRPRGENQGQNREGYRSRDGWQGQGGGYRPRGENQGQNRDGYKPRDGWQGQGGGYRPRGENQGQGREGFRPRGENQGQNREGFRPRGEFRPEHQNSEVPMDMSGRTGNKKFFKAKKKTDYQKNKKENIEEIEKNFQIKKKDVQKANPVPKNIDIMEVITVAELAKKLNLKASEVITKFISMGMMVTINQQVDAASAEIIASEYDCKVNIVSLYEQTIVEGEKGDDADIVERPPVVTVMGHVDHGKTHLLDAIRETNVAGGEYGGITQHIGAYKVEVKGRSIVFLDTPGHEAFTQMRARGAQLTDIVVLVVAADDGVMPQTIEAINHAKEAKVPIVVAINKIDLPDANPEKIKQQLAEYELIPEEWGGNTIFCNISAKKKIGIDDLLDNILILADVLELKANPNCRAEGKIIESRVDQGRGMVSTVLIQRGTLKIGDAFVAGVYAGKVRAMFNDKGEKIESAGPATPVEILGFTGLPNSGDPFQVTESEKYARHIGEKRQELERIGVAKNVKKVTLDNLYDSIQEGEIQELKVIIKSDVQGSVEALKSTLEKLSTPEIRLHIIHASAGAIVENDVNLAAASNAIIVGFHVRPTSKAQVLAEQEKVEIKKYNIIYDAVEDIKRAMEGLLAPELKEELIGTVEVRDIFKVPKVGTIAGAYVTSGKVKRNAIAHLYREEIELFNGKIISLKRFKDDAKEVEKGFECGIGLENYNDIQIGDILEVFEIKEIAKKL